eukprot:TRINITY_DN5097_c0_g2_i1.p1 TRINITY_DN5097_c0_g2~~TRINITY_DN5097_c0_g2_i1.p1  ORF type:complete len:1022 (+),score=97.54 TRINITY_DN5097_c0_g2_i1:184-3249(+)
MATARHFTKLPHRRPSQEIEMDGASNGSGSSGGHGGSDVEDSLDVSAELTNMMLAARNGSPSTVRKQSSSFLSATAASAVAGARHEDSIEETESRVQRTASGTDETTDEESGNSSSPKRSRSSPKPADKKRSPKTKPAREVKRSPSMEETQSSYMTSVKIRFILQHASFALIVMTIVRSSIALWTAMYLTARTFAWLPFAFEAAISLLCAAVGAGIYGERASRSKIATFFVLLWLFLLQFAINVAMFVFLGPLFGDAFFEEEPGAPLNDNWAWLYGLMIFYFIISIFVFVLNWAICVLLAIHTILWARGDFAEEPSGPRHSTMLSMSFWARAFSHNNVLWTVRVVFCLLIGLFVALFLAGLAGWINTLTQSGYCAPSIQSCYRGCDPIDPTECIYPFPSTFFMKEDDAMPSGWRMDIDRRALPQTRAGGNLEPTYYNELDGWSTIGPLLFNLKTPDVNTSDLTSHTNIPQSLSVSSTVYIINVDKNTLVPHWVEIDAVDYASNPSIMIQPAVPLEWATRYVVGVRRVRNSTGSPIEPTSAMKLLLDPVAPPPGAEISLKRWNYYQQNIFPALASRGFLRTEIQIAWDFVTASRQNTLGRAEFMRDMMLSIHTAKPLRYKINGIENADCATPSWNTTVGRTVYGEVYVPSFLDSTARLAKLPRSLDGKRLERFNVTGVRASKFIIRIPCSLINNPRPAKALIQYGHGLFGSRTEVKTRWISSVSNRFDWIFFASDWFGMAQFDVLAMARVLLGDPTSFVGLPESSLQGFVDKSATLRVILDQISVNEPSLRVQNVSLLDRPGALGSNTSLAYYGISQGGILGGAYAAFSRDHTRAVLGVPGSPYALLLGRSHDFSLYKTLFQLNMYTWRHIRIALAMMGQLWDPAESAGWLSSFNQQPQPDMPKKIALLQPALGDAQVTTLGAHIMARAYGAYTVSTPVRPIWGVPELPSPLPANSSAIVEWEFTDTPPEPIASVPPEAKTDTHECPRRQLEGQLQIRDFVEQGIIRNYCAGGVCRKATCDR